MIKVPVPFKWIYYVLHPGTFDYILKRINIPEELYDELEDEFGEQLTNVIVPMEMWISGQDVPNGKGSSKLFFVFDNEELAVMFKLKYL